MSHIRSQCSCLQPLCQEFLKRCILSSHVEMGTPHCQPSDMPWKCNSKHCAAGEVFHFTLTQVFVISVVQKLLLGGDKNHGREWRRELQIRCELNAVALTFTWRHPSHGKLPQFSIYRYNFPESTFVLAESIFCTGCRYGELFIHLL